MRSRSLLLLPLLLLPAVSMAQQAAPSTLVVGTFPQRMADRYAVRHGLPAERVTALALKNDAPWARAGGRLYSFAGGRWTEGPRGAAPPGLEPPGNPSVLDTAAGKDGWTWEVRRGGLFRHKADTRVRVGFPRFYLTNQRFVNTDAELTSVAVDRNGTVWLGSTVGLFATDGASYWNPVDRTDGLPWEHVTCVALGPNGDLWAGTTEGVCRYANGVWQYYWGTRWLPNNRVNDIAVDAGGAAWVATDGGVARLYDRPLTLAEKAARYQRITDARHNRRGFVTGARLRKPGDPGAGVVHEASDNDGLWTAVYVGAQSFRWAATKDPAAREAASRSMGAMLDLVRYTGIRGFPARAIIRKGEEVDGYNPDETVRVEGEKDKIWFQSPVDPNVLCKGDTSSDELDGHYFAWAVFYDLAANEEEKKAVRRTVEAVTDNLLEHDLTLVGHTGRKTRWGVYHPKYINDDPAWWEERGLNALSILSYLKVAEHITGHRRYAEKYRELIDKHHYLLNAVRQKVAEPWDGVNHSDDQMAFMMYYAYMRLERDPDTRRVLLQSIERSWNIERPEASPFFNFVYGASTGRPCDVEAAVSELREWPWELVEWSARGSHRHDVQPRTRHSEGRARSELTRALPASERRLMRWNGNPYQADGGTPEGRSEEDGSAWLLPYWMGRYHGFIAER